MTKHFIYILFLGLGFLNSCVNSPSSTLNDLTYFELFKPLLHAHDSQVYVLSDYLEMDQIDSINSDDYTIELIEEQFRIKPKAHSVKHSELKIYSKGVPYSLPVFRMDSANQSLASIPFYEVGLNKSSIQVEKSKHKVLAYWNNLRLALDSSEHSYIADLPPFAKYLDNSHLCLYIIREDGSINQLVCPVKKSKMVQELKHLRQDQVMNGIGLANLPIQIILKNKELIKRFNASIIEDPKSLALAYGSIKVIASNDTALVIERSYLNESYLIGFNKSGEAVKLLEFGEELEPFSFRYRPINASFKENH